VVPGASVGRLHAITKLLGKVLSKTLRSFAIGRARWEINEEKKKPHKTWHITLYEKLFVGIEKLLYTYGISDSVV